MKIKTASLLLALTLAARLGAQPLAASAAVHTQPDAASPVLATLPAGTEPFAAVGVTPPAGWLAVALPGPHSVFVRNDALTKDLTVKSGSSYLLAAKADAPVVALADKGDKAAIKNLAGRFTELTLEKSLVGYITAPPAAPPAPVPAVVVNPPAPVPETPRDLAVVPAPPKPAPAATTPDLPRLFQGTLASTRAPLRPRRPYDYELRDANGNRFAYVDTTRLVTTAVVDSYLDSVVVVYGIARAVPGSPDMVIAAETLQTR